MYRAGFGRADMTIYEPGMVMQGWASQGNRVSGVGTPLFARAFVVEAEGTKLAFVCADLNTISTALRAGVIAALGRDHAGRGLDAHNVMLTATHTHSGPSGYSQYAMYNAANFGFSPYVWSGLVDAIVAAIVMADDVCEPVVLRLGESQIPEDEPVAFNRSIASYLRNREASAAATTTSAVDRRSVTLRADRMGGTGGTLGIINWLGVHASNVHGDQTLLHGDNKGLAALGMERDAGEADGFVPGFVAIFAQAAAGDVQPNFRVDAQRGLLVGAHDEDHASAAANADIQVHWARVAHAQALSAAPLTGRIRTRTMTADLGAVEVDADLAGRRGVRTLPAQIGLAQAAGNPEGPGPLLAAAALLRGYAALHHAVSPAGDAKPHFLDVGRGLEGRVLGLLPTRWAMPFVARFEPMIAFLHTADKAGELLAGPWVPNVLPLQLAEIGDLAILALPVELTVTAARRLRATVAFELAQRPPRTVVTQGYANAYAGYLCTQEEYQRQAYEAGATYFGPHSLAAWQTLVRRLARKPEGQDGATSGPLPDRFDPAQLVRQRIAGRRGVRGPGSEAYVPAAAHSAHLGAFT